MTYNLTGGVAWVSIMCLLGYFMGNVPILQKHIDLVTLAIVFVSVIPVGLHVLQERKAAVAAKA